MFTQNISATKNTLRVLKPQDYQKQETPVLNVEQAIVEACEQVAPIWPLANFIAVNPLQGFEKLPFSEAVEIARKTYHARGVADLSFFHEQFKKGRITTQDLVNTVDQLDPSLSPTELSQVLIEEAKNERSGRGEQPLQEVFLSLSEWADQLTATKLYPAMQAEISKWCAAYFDRGEAAWGMPGKSQGFYAAWKGLVIYDESFERAGVEGFREYVKNLPMDSVTAIKKMVADLGIPQEFLKEYLSRHLAASPGWAGLMANLGRDLNFFSNEEKLKPLFDFLAVRLAYDVVGSRQVFADEWVKRNAWEGMVQRAQEQLKFRETGGQQTSGAGFIWLEAYERNYRESLLKKLQDAQEFSLSLENSSQLRPQAQAVFCIDVRSEAFRRNLEHQGRFDTYGFAGFFAVPLAHQGFVETEVAAQCPVLIRPKYLVREALKNPNRYQAAKYLSQKEAEGALEHALHEVKNTSVSPFAMVETFGGLGFFSMFLKSWAPTSLLKAKESFQRLWGEKPQTVPVVEVREAQQVGSYQVGIPIGDQIAIAENSLKIMGLLNNFGRLVLLCGHGSSTTNNAYASALDCGACGGHRGAPNARVAVEIFNNQRVRNALALKGISIPLDTVFVAGEHNTATDEVIILDEENIPKSHFTDLAQLKLSLSAAKKALNLERTQRFDAPAESEAEASREVARRSLDWSEARPEWGLAGNAAFIVAKRKLTQGLNLESRSFLHSYDWESDTTGAALEVIMTAPMVVAEWINTQYYFSTVDNEVFGSGSKVIHNVVGKMGVMQGNVSDLKIGLPLQSVSDGKNFVHEPMRLLVVIEAPRDRIEYIIKKHESVSKLVLNEWIRLVALEPSDRKFYRYSPKSRWEVETH